ncbi:ComEA family DNA-binding protein [Xanthocytophaga agilis]|uniref:Helix-hairpin-helix domain-containing protein n=1 Tax=Xanthocytophaga agilis TaxID=3048010 RepID=A0AAE3UED0_9BACT|nr:helix-hairpin-helix domain-containing protein [Xanthocytophaga agilis]MDJ1502663.1 helix-hairpin-helix domain-containing protein [Xanthocytophaga agilis]
MRKQYVRLQQFLGFTRKETNGFLILSGLMLLAILAMFLIPVLWPTSTYDPVTDKRQLDSLVALLDTTTQPVFQRVDTKQKETIIVQKLFNFNPNTISVTQWQQLGVPEFLATRISKYKNKGGVFHIKSDLKKIYDFPPVLYEQLYPYIQLPESMDRKMAEHFPEKKNDYKTDRYSIKKETAIARFDLNMADTNQLMAIKGIGPALSKRIIKYRDALGGFRALEQVHEVYGLDSLVVHELLKYAYLSERIPVKTLRINTASVEEIDAHPYISPKLAKIIVAYRQQHGAYHSVADLEKIKILDQTTLQKIIPYVSFE